MNNGSTLRSLTLAWVLVGMMVAVCNPAEKPAPAEAPSEAVKLELLLNQLYPDQSTPVSVIDSITTGAPRPKVQIEPTTPSMAVDRATTGPVMIIRRSSVKPRPVSPDQLPSLPGLWALEDEPTTGGVKIFRESFLTSSSLMLPFKWDIQRLLRLPTLPVPPGPTVEEMGPKRAATSRPIELRATPRNPKAVLINAADAKELMKKLKLDARRARLIIEFRQIYGPFGKSEDLAQVNGIHDDMIRIWEELDLLEY